MDHSPSILVAEDDFEDRYIMTSTFDELGYEHTLKVLDDGLQLIAYLNTVALPHSIKLIILDLNMPKMNGTETLRVIKEDPRFGQIPIVFFSTSINDVEKKACFALGAKDYITKPTKYADYVATCKMFYELSQDSSNTQ